MNASPASTRDLLGTGPAASERDGTRSSPQSIAVRDVDGFVDLDDYGVVGNGCGVAVIALDGGVDWWAVPRLDAPPVFSALLDPVDGGRCSLRPVDPRAEVVRRYLPGTNVLETTYRTVDGTATVVDSLNVGNAGALPWSELARRVTGVTGSVRFALHVAPGTGLGRWGPWTEDDSRGALLHAGDTTLAVRAPDGVELDVQSLSVRAHFVVGAGERCVIGVVASADRPLFLTGVDAIDARIDLSVSRWRQWSDQVCWDAPRREQVVRSALALKLLLMSETGAIAAAATTSLPEMVGGPKNWDYRYCWIRDTVLTVDALSVCGFEEEVHAAVSWLLRTIRRHGPDIHVMYTLDGDLLETSSHAAVPGYRDSRPVMIGNDAISQVQLGIYGELFGTVAKWVADGHVLDVTSARQLADLADRCADVWRHDDAGIWELQQNRPYTSSKMNCWRALDAAARLAADGHLAGPAHRWRAAADRIHAWVDEHCWSERKQAYTFYAGTDELDASVLLAAGYGFDTGARMSSTIDAIVAELGVGPLVYRYSGVHAEEQTFVACAYWLVGALAIVGRLTEARCRMDDLDRIANPLGLLAEMSTPGTFALTGNLPQALSHLALINAAATLRDAEQKESA
ncbi:glycoside hydrolase family 15 protein [Nakamurella flava]|uniref:glycoside hydrolase family 15 protein n=1 Tax=Nakamurella flava TaxID=2576308 RepID=UPI00197BD369|nr:glycoside hydrolase family 15 protein [Nakamurella flava]